MSKYYMRFAEMILIGAMLFQCGNTSVAFAKPIEQSEYGYVFSVKDTSVDLASIGEKSAKVDYLSGNLFYSETLDAAYEFAGNNIECIAPDAPVELHEYPKPNDTYYPFQWQFEVGNMKEYYSKNITGKGVIVGIIDSGVFREHEEFTNTNILKGLNVCAYMDSNYDNYFNTNDEDGHGTEVTSLIAAETDNGKGIAGITDECTIIPFKIKDRNSQYSLMTSTLLTAITTAVDYGCDIINISAGVTDMTDDLKSLMQKVILYAEENGCIVVASAGNDGMKSNKISYPAGFDTVIGVTSLTKYPDGSYGRSNFSSYNSGVNVIAPGENLFMAYKDGDYVFNSGTSFAAPIVTAAAIGIKQNCPDMSPEEFRKLLYTKATDIDIMGYDYKTGYGLIEFGGMLYETLDQKLNINPIPTNPPTEDTDATSQPSESKEDLPVESLIPTEPPNISESPVPEPTETPVIPEEPTDMPVETPTPTVKATSQPTEQPPLQSSPSVIPTIKPTETPEITQEPEVECTSEPTIVATEEPTNEPIPTETPRPSVSPTITPSVAPTTTPSEAPKSTLLPTETPKPTEVPNKPSPTPNGESRTLSGDVNHSGTVDNDDAVLVMLYVLGQVDENMLDLSVANVYDKTSVILDNNDAVTIMEYVLGRITQLF